MEKKRLKKLSLGKEMISHLTAQTQRRVLGGANEPTNDSCAPYGTCDTQTCAFCTFTEDPVGCEFTIGCTQTNFTGASC